MNRVFIVAVPDEVEISTTILNSPVIFSGIGKINATMAAYRAFTEGYDEVINIGSCGSLFLLPGTLVKVGQVYQDIDVTPLSEYGKTPFEASGKQILLDINSPIKCFTTDYFYDANQISKYSSYYLDNINKNDIFDMECFAIAKVCKRFNIKFSSYKWVSDDGDPHTWKANCKLGFDKLKKLLDE